MNSSTLRLICLILLIPSYSFAENIAEVSKKLPELSEQTQRQEAPLPQINNQISPSIQNPTPVAPINNLNPITPVVVAPIITPPTIGEPIDPRAVTSSALSDPKLELLKNLDLFLHQDKQVASTLPSSLEEPDSAPSTENTKDLGTNSIDDLADLDQLAPNVKTAEKTQAINPQITANNLPQNSAQQPEIKNTETVKAIAPTQLKEPELNTSKGNTDAPKSLTHDLPLVEAKDRKLLDENNAKDDLILKESENKSNNLSSADAAYIGMIEDKKQDLPKEKILPKETQKIMSKLTDNMIKDKKPRPEVEYIDIEHGTGLKNELEDPKQKEQKFAVSVKNASSDEIKENSDRENTLNMANKALISGQISAAIRMYKTILVTNPKDIDAMFGLAASYHRDKQYDQARKLYSDILKFDSHHKEALNNFLGLAAEQSPDDALLELQKLARINPDFSPISAQIGMIYLRINNLPQAETYLNKALTLSPDNVLYQYNLAIIYDKSGKTANAIDFYEKVISAEGNGASIPGSYSQIKKRLEYLKKKQK